MRAAILPTPCDPLLLNYWLSFYDNIWGKEIDRLYIYANSNASDEVFKYINDRCKRSKNITLLIDHKQIEHGDAINLTLNHVNEDYLLLLEDDCFIFKNNNLPLIFENIENNNCDIVGSKRGSCSQEILDRASELWGLSYLGLGDQGCNFWPNLFFTRTKILKDSSRNFGAKQWNKGEYSTSLRHTFNEVAAGDTFVYMSLELRSKGYKIKYIPQYHANPNDIEDSIYNRFLFDGQAPWVHFGSLSSGAGGLIRDIYNRPLNHPELEKQDKIILPNKPNTEMERWEYERRVSAWLMAYEAREKHELIEYSNNYYNGLQELIKQFGLNIYNIEQRIKIYHQLGL